MASIRQALAMPGTTPALIDGIVAKLTQHGLDCDAPGGVAGTFLRLSADALKEDAGLSGIEMVVVLTAQGADRANQQADKRLCAA